MSLDIFCDFQLRRHLSIFYNRFSERALQATANAGKAEVALRGYQRIKNSNLKEAMPSYLSDLVKQSAVVSVDWWDKSKPLRISIKGNNAPQYFKPIPEFIDKFGVLFPTAQRATDLQPLKEGKLPQFSK